MSLLVEDQINAPTIAVIATLDFRSIQEKHERLVRFSHIQDPSFLCVNLRAVDYHSFQLQRR